MQIKIEIDVKPEELRRFLGLPDVAGLQDDVVRFLREKVSAAGEGLDASAVVQNSIDLIRRNPAWQLLRNTLTPRERAEEPAADEGLVPATKARKRKAANAASSKAPSQRKPRKKKTASADAES